jgi:3-deoxy-D-manno-octulosonic-acid transferase
MVSGRVSARTAARARWLRPLYRPALADVTCCMQTADDARRIVDLGADSRRVVVAGCLKFEGEAAEPSPEVQRLTAALEGRRVIVAGSTHEGEEEIVLGAFRRVLPGRRELVLVLAPRHPERFAGVATLVSAAGLPLVRYSTLPTTPLPDAPTVVLLDAVGPLAATYAAATAAFVGGSLVPIGGHNLLEPARAGRPILVGPHTENAADVAERLVAGGAALVVRTEESLAWALAALLDEPGRAADMGRRARALVESGQGALERHLKIIAARLSSARFAQAAG